MPHDLPPTSRAFADAPQVVDLHDRIREGEQELTQAELGLALAERWLEDLRSRA